MLKEYAEVLDDESAYKLQEVLSWKNVKLISEPAHSKAYMASAEKAVVLSAAGMLSKGRSRLWLKRIIEDSRNTVLFVGYASENTLAAAIKNSKGSRGKIKIDDREYRNRCKIVDLKSFTSHMQYDDLLNYYSSISADKICLVHSEQLGKLEFAKVLQETIEKRGSRARVVCVNRYTSIKL
jgi:Cft2 family RNA processing exonuclease